MGQSGLDKLWPDCCESWAICPHDKRDREIESAFQGIVDRASGEFYRGNAQMEESVNRWRRSHNFKAMLLTRGLENG